MKLRDISFIDVIGGLGVGALCVAIFLLLNGHRFVAPDVTPARSLAPPDTSPRLLPHHFAGRMFGQAGWFDVYEIETQRGTPCVVFVDPRGNWDMSCGWRS